MGSILWPLSPKIDTATWAFLGPSDIRHGIYKDNDTGHDHFFKSTGLQEHFCNSTGPHNHSSRSSCEIGTSPPVKGLYFGKMWKDMGKDGRFPGQLWPDRGLLYKQADDIRDWSLITGRGDYKMGKSRVRNIFTPPP